ncbi:MAG: hypothetical protein KDN05_23495, partial [Verrucomicrobiae bacterium]|nr:hypothetical protein [Verrucomicrobiae bacterium]
MKPKRTNPILPRLLGAAFASLASLSAQSISINFGANQTSSAVDEAAKTSGAVPIAGNLWNNTTVNGGGTLGSLIDSTGATTAASVTWTAQNTWQSGSSGATATSENGDLTKGYLDDSGAGWTVNMDSPYLLNDIYVIHATDQGNPATMSAVSVNGTFYTGNGAGGTVAVGGSGSSWSAANFSTADVLVESTNFIKVEDQTGVSLAGLNSSPGRSAIAGLQVVNAYTGTLSFWDTNGATAGSGNAGGTWGTDSFWTADATGSVATGAWSSGSAAVFSAGTDGTGLLTVTVNGTQTADAIWVQEGDITLSGGVIDLSAGSGILRGDDPDASFYALTIDSSIQAADLTIAGEVEFGGSNTITGTVTVLGTALVASNQSWNQIAGSGTLDLFGGDLTVGA